MAASGFPRADSRCGRPATRRCPCSGKVGRRGQSSPSLADLHSDGAPVCFLLETRLPCPLHTEPAKPAGHLPEHRTPSPPPVEFPLTGAVFALNLIYTSGICYYNCITSSCVILAIMIIKTNTVFLRKLKQTI